MHAQTVRPRALDSPRHSRHVGMHVVARRGKKFSSKKRSILCFSARRALFDKFGLSLTSFATASASARFSHARTHICSYTYTVLGSTRWHSHRPHLGGMVGRKLTGVGWVGRAARPTFDDRRRGLHSRKLDSSVRSRSSDVVNMVIALRALDGSRGGHTVAGDQRVDAVWDPQYDAPPRCRQRPVEATLADWCELG